MKSYHSDCTYCGLILNMRCSVSNKTNTIIVFIFHVSPDKQFFNSSSYFLSFICYSSISKIDPIHCMNVSSEL